VPGFKISWGDLGCLSMIGKPLEVLGNLEVVIDCLVVASAKVLDVIQVDLVQNGA